MFAAFGIRKVFKGRSACGSGEEASGSVFCRAALNAFKPGSRANFRRVRFPVLERRRQTIARLRQQGVLVVETTPAGVGASAISKYLEVKAQGLL